VAGAPDAALKLLVTAADGALDGPLAMHPGQPAPLLPSTSNSMADRSTSTAV
jgi:hypothetical protein